MQNMYWYRQGDERRGLRHVVFASTQAIARWYVSNMSIMRGAKFMEMRNRPATQSESTTVLAHSADKALLTARDLWRANGGNSEYMATLDRLAKSIEVL